jgi:hypothetical protein
MARYSAANDTGERRTAGFTVQFTPSERAQLGDAARQNGAPLGEYIRELCLRRGGQTPIVAGTQRNPDAKRLADEIRAVGINLNQLTHIANATGDIRRGDAIDMVLELVVRALSRVIELT